MTQWHFRHPNEILADEKRHQELVEYIRMSGVSFRCLSHPPCRSSTESAAARATAGAPGSIGAKALLVRATAPISFVMAVIPGNHRLRNDQLRALIGKFRFASIDEIVEVTDGLDPGRIPPFGDPVFPAVSRLVVDEVIFGLDLIGFNASHHERSIVMSGKDYGRLVPSSMMSIISEPL